MSWLLFESKTVKIGSHPIPIFIGMLRNKVRIYEITYGNQVSSPHGRLTQCGLVTASGPSERNDSTEV